MNTQGPSFLIGSSSLLQVYNTYNYKVSDKFKIRSELAALDRLKKSFT